MEKKRSIVDYSNVTPEILEALNSRYPYGFEGKTVKFKNSKGETITAVPVETDDSSYLVKIGSKLEAKMEAYLNDEDDDDYDDDEDFVEKSGASKIKMDDVPEDDEDEEEDSYDKPDDEGEDDED